MTGLPSPARQLPLEQLVAIPDSVDGVLILDRMAILGRIDVDQLLTADIEDGQFVAGEALLNLPFIWPVRSVQLQRKD